MTTTLPVTANGGSLGATVTDDVLREAGYEAGDGMAVELRDGVLILTRVPRERESSETYVDMSFKVPAKFHRRFKRTSSNWGMSMKELLEASYKEWVEKHGMTPPDLDDD